MLLTFLEILVESGRMEYLNFLPEKYFRPYGESVMGGFVIHKEPNLAPFLLAIVPHETLNCLALNSS